MSTSNKYFNGLHTLIDSTGPGTEDQTTQVYVFELVEHDSTKLIELNTFNGLFRQLVAVIIEPLDTFKPGQSVRLILGDLSQDSSDNDIYPITSRVDLNEPPARHILDPLQQFAKDFMVDLLSDSGTKVTGKIKISIVSLPIPKDLNSLSLS